MNDKCIPFKAAHDLKLQSLETCNMLCSGMQLWPQPTGAVSLAATAVPVRADLITLDTVEAPSRIVRQHVRDAFELFRHELSHVESNFRGFEEWYHVIVRVSVKTSKDPRMRMDTDESYELTLKPANSAHFTLIVDIMAQSFCGARHGIETLSQLIWLDTYAESLIILQAADISDSPKFRYRGLMLDTARNYFTFSDLIRTIDAMAASKLNTFHWHISDSQAFALHLNSVPQLAEYGAYSGNDVYTPEQVRALSRRARLRGIRILIEVDVPAHVGRAWKWGPSHGLGDLVYCVESKPWTAYCSEPPCGQLNPLNPHVFEIFQSVLFDIIQMTGVDDVFHLGGDDVSERCWNENLDYNQTDPMSAWIVFTKNAIQRLEAVNGKLPNLTIFWYSHLSERIKTDLREYVHMIGLQVRSVEWAKKYVTGLRTVLSHEDAWDLNSGLGHWFEDSSGVPYNSWQRVYEHRPWARGGGPIEGGEATVWSRSLHREDLDSTVWPRAAALAERLWTDRPEGATRPVHARLDVHRVRLMTRGVLPAPIWSTWCTHNTFTC